MRLRFQSLVLKTNLLLGDTETNFQKFLRKPDWCWYVTVADCGRRVHEANEGERIGFCLQGKIELIGHAYSTQCPMSLNSCFTVDSCSCGSVSMKLLSGLFPTVLNVKLSRAEFTGIVSYILA
jgi:hypothetical protein